MTSDPAYRHGGPGAGWYLRTMGGWRRISDTEAANERYEGMRHFMHDPNELSAAQSDHGSDTIEPWKSAAPSADKPSR
jgi:hypothetical protein